MKTYDLYGSKKDDMSALRRSIERAVGVELDEHESSYHCGIYFRHGSEGGECLILQRNFDALDREWTEEAFPDAPLLLYVNATRRCEEIESALARALPDLKLLRRDEFDR